MTFIYCYTAFMHWGKHMPQIFDQLLSSQSHINSVSLSWSCQLYSSPCRLVHQPLHAISAETKWTWWTWTMKVLTHLGYLTVNSFYCSVLEHLLILHRIHCGITPLCHASFTFLGERTSACVIIRLTQNIIFQTSCSYKMLHCNQISCLTWRRYFER